MTAAASVSRIAERAAELRREFDQSFMLPPTADVVAKVDLLAIRLGGKGFAIRLAEISGVFAGKKITRVPGTGASVLGIAGFRGSIVPVYDLHGLLGEPAPKAPRWMLVAAAASVAFAFEGFDGQIRATADSIKPQGTRATHGFTNDFVEHKGVLRPVIQLSSVLDAIKT